MSTKYDKQTWAMEMHQKKRAKNLKQQICNHKRVLLATTVRLQNNANTKCDNDIDMNSSDIEMNSSDISKYKREIAELKETNRKLKISNTKLKKQQSKYSIFAAFNEINTLINKICHNLSHYWNCISAFFKECESLWTNLNRFFALFKPNFFIINTIETIQICTEKSSTI